jgi:hypothetical protein
VKAMRISRQGKPGNRFASRVWKGEKQAVHLHFPHQTPRKLKQCHKDTKAQRKDLWLKYGEAYETFGKNLFYCDAGFFGFIRFL